MGARGVARVVTLALACALACATTATAADIGANDDAGKFAPDAGASLYGEMAAVGLGNTFAHLLEAGWRPLAVAFLAATATGATALVLLHL